MKKLIIIAIFTIIGINGYGQTMDTISNNYEFVYNILKASEEMITYTEHVYNGYTIMAVGAGFVCASILIEPEYEANSTKDSNQKIKNILYGIGGGISLIGIIYVFESHSHIKKAGNLLKLSITGNGIGLSYKINN